jgi:hypothetical protein
MSEEKSPIQSFGVSLGSSPAPSSSAQQLEPWNILVCSDLGFKSTQPELLRIADWNEFIGSKKIALSGTVENTIERDGKPFFIELALSSIKDFTSEVLLEKIGFLSGYARVYFALTQLLDGKIKPDDALEGVEVSGLPPAEKARIRSLLGTQNSDLPIKPQEKTQRTGINSILSMVDFGENKPEEIPESSTQKASDAFITSITASSGQSFQKGPVQVYVNSLKAKIQEQVVTIQKQPFFASPKASWQCLMDLARTIGRNKEIHLSAFSGTPHEMEENFTLALESSIETATVPDIILWDFYADFTTASIDRLTKIAQAVDQCKSVILVPISTTDDFLDNCSKRESIVTLLQDLRYLPYKKFRSNPSSRCVSLVGPSIQFPGVTRLDIVPDADQAACGGWALLSQWISSIISKSDPFSITNDILQDSVLFDLAKFSLKISRGISEEAALAGLTLLDTSPISLVFDRAVSAIDSEKAGAAYSSLGFNILVNRVARLAVMRLSMSASQASKENAAKDLCLFLQKELTPYHVLSSPDQVSASVGQSGEIELTVNSEVSVSGFPAQFSFSLNL